jgi:GAF domain-containing protein
MDTYPDTRQAIATAARTINHHHSLGETLQRIVESARESVPGFDEVGISALYKDGRIETQASTGELVRTLDSIQYDLGEGPCFDSLHESDVVSAPNLRHDQRWPRYVPEAVAAGVKSQLAVKLYLDDEGTLGGINFYSTVSSEVDHDAKALADLFAAHAAIALGHAQEREQLTEALQSRKVIGMAIGILMERYQMDENRAFAFLVRASSHGNTKLRVVAQELIDQVGSRGHDDGPAR